MNHQRWIHRGARTVLVAALLGVGGLWAERPDDPSEPSRCVAWWGLDTLIRFRSAQDPRQVPGLSPTRMLPFDLGSADAPAPAALVLDETNHALYVVAPSNLSDGQMEAHLLAGQPGVAGFLEESGEAALFHSPAGMTLDPAGRLYVADTGNGAIRRVLRTGAVETVAWGPDDYTPFERPVAVAYGRLLGREKLAVADQDGQAVYILDLEDASVPTIRLPFTRPTHLDWWKDPEASPEEADGTWGILIVANDEAIYQVRVRGDADLRVSMVANIGVNSLFIEERGHLYITTPDNTGIAWMRRSSSRYDPLEPLTACGEALQSPQVATTYFGQLLIADREAGGLRLKTTRLKVDGAHGQCVRCGPGGPFQSR